MLLWHLLLHGFNLEHWAQNRYFRHIWQAFLAVCAGFLVVKYFGLVRSIAGHTTFMETVRLVGIVIWVPLALSMIVAILTTKGERFLSRVELLFVASLATHALPMVVLKRMGANLSWWPAIIGLVAFFVALYSAVTTVFFREASTPQPIHVAPKALKGVEVILKGPVSRSDRRGVLLRCVLLAAGCWTLYSNAQLVAAFTQSLVGMSLGLAAAHTAQIALEFAYLAGFGMMFVFWVNSWTQGPEDGLAMSIFPVIVMFGTPLLIQLCGIAAILIELGLYLASWIVLNLVGLVASGWSDQALASLAALDEGFDSVMDRVGNSGVLSMIAPWRISFAGWLVLILSWFDQQKQTMQVPAQVNLTLSETEVTPARES